jgi:hypothetical protein
MRRKHDAELRDLLTSNRSDEEVEQADGRQQELVEGAAPWNKGVVVDELLEGSCDEKTRQLKTTRSGTRRLNVGRRQLLILSKRCLRGRSGLIVKAWQTRRC